MTIAKAFLILGAVYLAFGIVECAHWLMDDTRSSFPLYTGLSLIGSLFMSVFGVIYLLSPNMIASPLGKAHFWLFQVGAIVLLSAKSLSNFDLLSVDAVGSVIAMSAAAMLLSVLAFIGNIYRRM